jgi:hypothetical protein
MIVARDNDAQFECSVNEVGDKYQARWAVFIIAAEIAVRGEGHTL